MTDNKRYWSYEQVHEIVRKAVEEAEFWDEWRPTMIICIAAGGFVPTRILRSCMKHKYGANIPIQTIGLQLYDVEGCDPSSSPVQRVQWLSYGPGPGQVLLQGEKILIVDEVDDSRKTLAHATAELRADITQEQQRHAQSGSSKPWQAPELGVFVLHNKLRPKLAEISQCIMQSRYWAGLDIENCWCVYPWDAEHIYEHTEKAEAAGLPGKVGEQRQKRQSSGCPALQEQQQSNGHATASVPHVNGQQPVPIGSAWCCAKQNGNAAANGVHAMLNGV